MDKVVQVSIYQVNFVKVVDTTTVVRMTIQHGGWPGFYRTLHNNRKLTPIFFILKFKKMLLSQLFFKFIKHGLSELNFWPLQNVFTAPAVGKTEF